MEEIVKKLKDQHGTTYSVEKLNIWAHMLHIERHDSYEVPPNVPYFNRSRPALQDKSNLQTIKSPEKRVSIRSECIYQLNKWHNLLEKNVITQKEYDKVQQTILQDIMDDT